MSIEVLLMVFSDVLGKAEPRSPNPRLVRKSWLDHVMIRARYRVA